MQVDFFPTSSNSSGAVKGIFINARKLQNDLAIHLNQHTFNESQFVLLNLLKNKRQSRFGLIGRYFVLYCSEYQNALF